MTHVFANCSDEEEIYPLTVKEIAEAQKKDKAMKQLKISEKYKILLIENLQVLCKDGKLVIPKSLQHRAVSWYHHYLQHPGHSRLEEMMRATIYWKGMQTTIQSYVKKCHSCQTNKRRKLKYGKLPTKIAITTPWEALCVDLVGPYDPATSWCEIVELPVLEILSTPIPADRKGTKVHKLPKEAYLTNPQP